MASKTIEEFEYAVVKAVMTWNGEDPTEILMQLGLPVPDRKTRYIVTITTDAPADGETQTIEKCVKRAFGNRAKSVTVTKALLLGG